jgi:hypothetical protein
MATKRRTPVAPQPTKMTTQQIRSAIPQLERRLNELKDLDVNSLTDENHADVLTDLHRRIDDTLANVFGHGTKDYDRYTIAWMDETPMVLSSFGEPPPSVHERRPYIDRGVKSAISTLSSAVSILKERLADSGDTAAARAVTAYSGLDLHPRSRALRPSSIRTAIIRRPLNMP